MSFISSKIMARLREEYIFVKNSYIKEFEKKNVKATIDPYAEEVKPLLEGVDEEGTGDNQYTKIYAYSFGPFRPRYFFEGNLKKFLWIVWEPYLCDMIQMRGRSEGIAQDMHYSHWGEAKKNCTLRNIIERTRVMLERNAIVYTGSEDEIMNKVMNHICIIEVNQFPGLALFYNEENDSYNTNSNKYLKKNG